jgi:hypothetical protein
VTSFPIVVATDGSAPARAAVAAAVAFPWPAGAEAYGVIARHEVSAAAGGSALPDSTRDALEVVAEQIRKDAVATLARRWPAAKVELDDRPPVEAILDGMTFSR